MVEDQKVIVVSVPGQRANFEKWIADRGGVQVWVNSDLGNPNGCPVFTPATTAAGDVHPVPHWSLARGPVVKGIGSFRFVAENIEVDRFRITTQRARGGLQLKLSDRSSRTVRARVGAAMAKYGRPIYYEFDYETRECILILPRFEGEDREVVLEEVDQCSA